MKKLFFVLFWAVAVFSIPAQNKNDVTANSVDKLLAEHKLNKKNVSAQDFNNAGMYFYDKKMWREAETMFSQAVVLDGRHVLARYNLACVMSIRSAQFPPYQGWENEILNESISHPKIFGYLWGVVRLDPSRGIRARQDADFDRLRALDSELFDAVTLPEEQRKRHTLNGTYVYTNFFEGDIRLIFAEPGYEEHTDDNLNHWHSFSGWDKKLDELNFKFFVWEDEVGWRDNEEKIGKKFEIVYIYYPGHSEFVGGVATYKFTKIISIKEIK